MKKIMIFLLPFAVLLSACGNSQVSSSPKKIEIAPPTSPTIPMSTNSNSSSATAPPVSQPDQTPVIVQPSPSKIPTPVTPSVPVVTPATPVSNSYTDPTYGYIITFPDSWKGNYVVEPLKTPQAGDEPGEIAVRYAKSADGNPDHKETFFTINVIKKDVWVKNGYDNSPMMRMLVERNGLVFAYTPSSGLQYSYPNNDENTIVTIGQNIDSVAQSLSFPDLLSINDAKSLVLSSITQIPNYKLSYDHSESGKYVFQYFEFVIDNPQTKEGHTITNNWYSIDPTTKSISKMFGSN